MTTLATARTTHQKIGLVLSGGGARGAYQAGVLQAIAEIRATYPECQPIRVITGVSAGAINAAHLAANCDDELEASRKLTGLWRKITSDQVFRTDALSLGRIGLKWLRDTTTGSLSRHKLARSLLDTAPLRELLAENIEFRRIPKMIAEKHLDAFAVTALNYANAHSISFTQEGSHGSMWDRSRRRAELASIHVDHIMASAAIPLFFPPVRVAEAYFGDGCLRNSAPLSPAIHLGADRLIVVSVRRPEDKARHVPTGGHEPSIARILGVMLNALLMDSIEFDVERLNRINATLDFIPSHIRSDLSLRRVEQIWIRPSEDIGYMASGEFKHLPTVVRYLLAGLGSSRESSELTSYLLFDPDYCGQLVDLGYKDTMSQSEEIRKFLSV